jgi:hypothetical protein
VNLEDTESAAEIAAPLSHGQDRDCSNESEIDALASRAELADEDLEELPERIAAAGIDVSDECGRERVPPKPPPQRRADPLRGRRDGPVLVGRQPLLAAHRA